MSGAATQPPELRLTAGAEDPPIGAAVDPVSATGEFARTGPAVNRVPPAAIGRWLSRGWADFRAAPGTSLIIGACCTVVSWVLVGLIAATDYAVLILPLLTGFMFAAPILALGLYESSRLQAERRPVTVPATWDVWRRNKFQIAFTGALLMLFLYGWMRVATMLSALFFGDNIPPLGAFFRSAFLSAEHADFAIIGTGIGAVLAAIVFGLSAVSLPMLVDRPTDSVTAMVTSMRACLANPVTMGLWAVIIVALTVLGALPGFLGFVVIIPLVGHATWHAYKDLVGAG
ncbi:DUF2189 domain-containing protein [Muricoccus radiodurans]|uniref:DUF2189 domain-containing protein n=1 Tax=Muricoccus radiodurans TaxID=2231721 RepID=UPI003CF71D14